MALGTKFAETVVLESPQQMAKVTAKNMAKDMAENMTKNMAKDMAIAAAI
jgi:hypothetical protein